MLQEKQASKYTIYQDMDGCLTDFDGRYEHFTGRSPEEMDKELTKQYGKERGREMFWLPADEVGTQFWSKMEWMPDGKRLWEYIKKYDPIILSSPSRSQTSTEGKKIWVKKNLPGTQLILRQAKDKVEFSGTNHILIDDRADTIESWNSKGGIGILHTSTVESIQQLKELGL